jgi:hypothetical protein
LNDLLAFLHFLPSFFLRSCRAQNVDSAEATSSGG